MERSGTQGANPPKFPRLRPRVLNRDLLDDLPEGAARPAYVARRTLPTLQQYPLTLAHHFDIKIGFQYLDQRLHSIRAQYAAERQ